MVTAINFNLNNKHPQLARKIEEKKLITQATNSKHFPELNPLSKKYSKLRRLHIQTYLYNVVQYIEEFLLEKCPRKIIIDFILIYPLN